MDLDLGDFPLGDLGGGDLALNDLLLFFLLRKCAVIPYRSGLKREKISTLLKGMKCNFSINQAISIHTIRFTLVITSIQVHFPCMDIFDTGNNLVT